MKTYQDYVAAGENTKAAFIMEAIAEYKMSEVYRKAVLGQTYYSRDNQAIVNRLTFLEKYDMKKSKVKFFKMRCGFFHKMCIQIAQYLLGNGITLKSDTKEKLGVLFDNDIQKAGLQALIDGVCWCFWNLDRLKVFRATEFLPLYNEDTGNIEVGIRFWQIAANKPLNVELYEIDGITKYSADGDNLVMIGEKQSYKTNVRKDLISTEVVGGENYNVLPIFPFYANELRESELSEGLKEDIDAFDFIKSDLVDTILQIEGIYWVVKNYGGNDLVQLRDELHELKMTYYDDEGEVESHNLEVPYNAKQVALELLEKHMYADTMTLDIKALQGGSLTNVAINVAKTDFDLKTDLFEYQAIEVIQSILSLLGINNQIPKFKRRSITNDTEIVNNISMMLADGYVDYEWAINQCPLIADEEQENLLQRIILADTGIPPDDTIIDE